MARARLRDRHQENLRRKLQVLKAEQAVTMPQNTENQQNIAEETSSEATEPKPSSSQDDGHISDNEG